METFITNSVFGFISFDEKLNIIEYENFKFDEIPLKITSIREGKILDEEIKIIESVDEKYDKINLESNRKLSNYSSLKNFNKIQLSSENIGGKHLRSNLEDILNEILKKDLDTISKENK
ncbi:MAG: hypothetical protein LBU40_05825, partial [Methanobrevibacter sp.]|nr:hypothetical protein [Methanobrevibacter sp.]